MGRLRLPRRVDQALRKLARLGCGLKAMSIVGHVVVPGPRPDAAVRGRLQGDARIANLDGEPTLVRGLLAAARRSLQAGASRPDRLGGSPAPRWGRLRGPLRGLGRSRRDSRRCILCGPGDPGRRRSRCRYRGSGALEAVDRTTARGWRGPVPSACPRRRVHGAPGPVTFVIGSWCRPSARR
jgi:hypothetical protein